MIDLHNVGWGCSSISYKSLMFGLVWVRSGYPETVGRKLFWRLCYYKPDPNPQHWVKVTPNDK